MYTVIVRAKKDADALKATLKVFYKNWDIRVKTLHGVRTLEKFYDNLLDAIDPDRFNIVLVGREDRDKIGLEKGMPINVAFFLVPKNKVRNARLTTIRESLENGRAKFRNVIYWNKTYILGRSEGVKLDFDALPAYDNFFLFGEKGLKALSNFLGDISGILLLVRKLGGEHDVFSGPQLIGKIKIPDFGNVKGEVINKQIFTTNIQDIVKSNTIILNTFENIALSLLRSLKSEYDTVIVPWSGGRDSTATLILASKVFKKNLFPIYVDMELEFSFVRSYIDHVSKILGLKVETAHVNLKEKVIEKGFPKHDDRWCTKLKINALHEKISEIASGKTLIVVGDRDAESELRSKRSPIRPDNHYMQVAPIKNWSASQAQIYIILNNIDLNPLYKYGFYRLGCWICSSLRSWERFLMRKYRSEILYDADRKLLDEFLENSSS
ncbi:MAG: phosphoadenosine phosphosulfate reductase family protein [Thermoproteales archaeon]|nr:phosphoadenosine phosphosulfate reductase family protein [Thermoproteales archaeon]